MAGYSPSKTDVNALMSRPTPADSTHVVAPIRLAQIQLSNSQRSACRACPVCAKASVIARILSGPGQAVFPSRPPPQARGWRAKRRGQSQCACIVADARRLLARLGGVLLRRRAALSEDRFILPWPEIRDAFRVIARPKPRAGLNGPPSASSSQGLIVVPGGAPAPPGCRSCETCPRAPHPLPLPDAS